MTELLPCKKCGGTPSSHLLARFNSPVFVSCGTCLITTPFFDDTESALDYWNKEYGNHPDPVEVIGLLPCKKCGEMPTTSCHKAGNTMTFFVPCPAPLGVCTNCTCYYETEEEAINAWNEQYGKLDVDSTEKPSPNEESSRRETFESDGFPYRFDLMSHHIAKESIGILSHAKYCTRDADKISREAYYLFSMMVDSGCSDACMHNSLILYISHVRDVGPLESNTEILKLYAAALHEGALKYGERNWEKGIPESNLINHAIFHLLHDLAGDTSENHLSHLVWNVLTLVHFRARKEEGVQCTA